MKNSKSNLMMPLVAAAICAATGNALATENIINYNTPGGTFNYGEGTTINKPGVDQRILVQSGTVNINTGAYVKAGGDATGKCNYVGVDNSGPAYLNINGGTVWCATDGSGAGCLGIGINNCAQPATVTLNSGLLRVDTQVRSATWWDSCNGTTSSGALVVNGGEAYVGQFVIGAHTASTGTSELTLNGGSLTVEELLFLQYNGQVFTWGNGTLVAARDNIFVVNAYTSQNNKTRTMEIAGTPATFNIGGFSQALPAFTGTGGLTVTGTGGSIAVSGSQAFTGDLTLSNGTALVVTDSATFAGRIVLGGANSKIRFDTANSQENVITLSATGPRCGMDRHGKRRQSGQCGELVCDAGRNGSRKHAAGRQYRRRHARAEREHAASLRLDACLQVVRDQRLHVHGGLRLARAFRHARDHRHGEPRRTRPQAQQPLGGVGLGFLRRRWLVRGVRR